MRLFATAVLITFLSGTYSYSQTTDTIRVMQYNLLNYAAADNPSTYKNPRLQTIIDYVQPDIFGANEIANGSQNSLNILNNVLGTTDWEKGNYINTNNQIQTNMLFWKKQKFGLAHQESIASVVRDIIAFKLYYKDPNLAQTHDTTFLTVIVAHLKAGENAQDSLDRAQETAFVVSYLNNTITTPGNYLFMGDMNVYSSNELCYSKLINSVNPVSRFYDPINRPGNWSGNHNFADIHSQSTRRSSLPDGGATGGLDDRFDQILVSGPVLNNQHRVGILPSSYHIVSQDGLHFNKGLTEMPTNTLVPANVLQALYEMSDHLPVTAQFVIQQSTGNPNGIAGTPAQAWDNTFTLVNPVRNKQLQLIYKGDKALELHLALYSSEGRSMLQAGGRVDAAHKEWLLPVDLHPGLYFLQLRDQQGHQWTTRLLQQ